jgi:Domain of unknown function (DUF4149)
VTIAQRMFRILWVLWAGSLWSLLWVAAVMFHFQSDRHLAGLIAARLFSIETYLGLGVGMLVLFLPNVRRFRLGYCAVALLLVNEWVLRPVMEVARTQGSALGLGFGPWHGVSALLYGLACILVAIMLFQEDLPCVS